MHREINQQPGCQGLADEPNVASSPLLDTEPARRGLPWGEVAKLAEKVAGRRKQDRVPWGGQRKKGTFRVGLGKVASAFPREEAVRGGQPRMLSPKLCRERSFSIFRALSSHHTGSSPRIYQIFNLQTGKLWVRDCEGPKSRAKGRACIQVSRHSALSPTPQALAPPYLPLAVVL